MVDRRYPVNDADGGDPYRLRLGGVQKGAAIEWLMRDLECERACEIEIEVVIRRPHFCAHFFGLALEKPTLLTFAAALERLRSGDSRRAELDTFRPTGMRLCVLTEREAFFVGIQVLQENFLPTPLPYTAALSFELDPATLAPFCAGLRFIEKTYLDCG